MNICAYNVGACRGASGQQTLADFERSQFAGGTCKCGACGGSISLTYLRKVCTRSPFLLWRCLRPCVLLSCYASMAPSQRSLLVSCTGPHSSSAPNAHLERSVNMTTLAVNTLSAKFDPEIRSFVKEKLPFQLPPKQVSGLNVTVALSNVFMQTLTFDSTVVSLLDGQGLNVTVCATSQFCFGPSVLLTSKIESCNGHLLPAVL